MRSGGKRRIYPAGLPDFFVIQTYQIVKNVPNDHKLNQTAIVDTKWP
jgi:hypothetical protein